MNKNDKYIWIDTAMGELQFHREVFDEVLGQYPEDQYDSMLNFFLQGCKNFHRHPQDVLNELERDLK